MSIVRLEPNRAIPHDTHLCVGLAAPLQRTRRAIGSDRFADLASQLHQGLVPVTCDAFSSLSTREPIYKLLCCLPEELDRRRSGLRCMQRQEARKQPVDIAVDLRGSVLLLSSSLLGAHQCCPLAICHGRDCASSIFPNPIHLLLQLRRIRRQPALVFAVAHDGLCA